MSMFDLSPLEPDALAHGEHFAESSLAAGFFSALVDEVECGLIACDGDGGLRFANRSARHELDSARALRLCGRRVRQAAGSSRALEAALHDASRGRRRTLAIGSEADRLLVSVIPLQRDKVNAVNAGEPAVLIVLGRRGPCSALGLEMLSMVHGLTLTERRVLRALLAGNVPQRIAVQHGVAVSTVRTHIKAIRDKVGVRSVEGLFIRAAEVPPVSSALRCGSGYECLRAPAERPTALTLAAA